METVIILVMILVSLAFMLKLTFMRPWQMVLESALVALSVVFSTDLAAMQSKSRIGEWLQTPEIMLDAAVFLTVDVALQTAFCISMAGDTGGPGGKILRNLLLFIPGILVLPVAFCLLVSLLFFFTGAGFYTVGCGLGVCLLILTPILSGGLKRLLPERAERLELIFLINCITGMLGIIAAVNGQTAAAGANEPDLPALLTDAGIVLTACTGGFLLYKRKLNE